MLHYLRFTDLECFPRALLATEVGEALHRGGVGWSMGDSTAPRREAGEGGGEGRAGRGLLTYR